jgi:hypothetical protein
MTGHSEVLEEHVAGKNIGRRQVFDGLPGIPNRMRAAARLLPARKD